MGRLHHANVRLSGDLELTLLLGACGCDVVLHARHQRLHLLLARLRQVRLHALHLGRARLAHQTHLVLACLAEGVLDELDLRAARLAYDGHLRLARLPERELDALHLLLAARAHQLHLLGARSGEGG